MIQGGDHTGTGRGGIGYTIPDEVDRRCATTAPGLLCMANRGPNTNEAQFFITEGAGAAPRRQLHDLRPVRAGDAGAAHRARAAVGPAEQPAAHAGDDREGRDPARGRRRRQVDAGERQAAADAGRACRRAARSQVPAARAASRDARDAPRAQRRSLSACARSSGRRLVASGGLPSTVDLQLRLDRAVLARLEAQLDAAPRCRGRSAPCGPPRRCRPRARSGRPLARRPSPRRCAGRRAATRGCAPMSFGKNDSLTLSSGTRPASKPLRSSSGRIRSSPIGRRDRDVGRRSLVLVGLRLASGSSGRARGRADAVLR